jgi:hypothetical protein
MNILLETELSRIKKMMGLLNEQNAPSTEEECVEKNNSGVNCYWSYKKEECVTCPDGKKMCYPSEECCDCDPDEEIFIPGVGCQKICDYDEYYNVETGECEEIPHGMFFDGKKLRDINENPSIMEYWKLINEKRSKDGKEDLNPYEKPSNQQDRDDWDEIFQNINFFLQEDLINGQQMNNSVDAWNEDMQDCLINNTNPPDFPL